MKTVKCLKDRDYFICPEINDDMSLAICEGSGNGEGCIHILKCDRYAVELEKFKYLYKEEIKNGKVSNNRSVE